MDIHLLNHHQRCVFAAYGIDKWKAQHNKWRISESALLELSVIGGALEALIAGKP